MAPRTLGVIPARAGSKRIKNKNLRTLCGKPLIAWTIEAANAASRLTTVVVSTEDENIAQVANLHEAYVIRRPDELATDEATTGSVLSHALEWMGPDYDLVVCLHPTSPVRDSVAIDEAVELLWNSQHDTLASVSCRKRNYQHNAALYIMRASWLRANPNKHFDDETIPFLMDRPHSIDIDDETDFQMAEFILNGHS